MSEREKGYKNGKTQGIVDHLGNVYTGPVNPPNGSVEYQEGFREGYHNGWNSVSIDDCLFS